MSEDLISIKNLSLALKGTSILQDLYFTIKKGGFTTIIGPNGAGKTSLIKIILGSKKQTSGDVIIDKNITVGYIPQKISLNKAIPITVKKFIEITTGSKLKHIPQILDKFHLSGFLNNDINKLSGGQMQKVLLSSAILKQPDLLILDEPEQNLDLRSQEELYKVLKQSFNERKNSTNPMTVISISHDLHRVMSQTEDVLCLYKHLCCHGKPSEIKESSQFKSIFGNLVLPYKHEHCHEHVV